MSGSISIRYGLGLDGTGQAKRASPSRGEVVAVGGWHSGKATRRAPSRFSLRAERDVDRFRSRSIPDEGDAADLDVVAIGSPLLDVIELATDEQLAQVGFDKGSMTLIDLAKGHRCPGAHARAPLCLGWIGGQHHGGHRRVRWHRPVSSAPWPTTRSVGPTPRTCGPPGVEFEPHVSETAAGDGLGTGRCIVLITEDADRTMGTYLGAASTMIAAGVPEAFVARASIVLLEGYLWDVPAAKEAMRHAAATAHAADGSVRCPCPIPSASAGTRGSSSSCCSTTSTSSRQRGRGDDALRGDSDDGRASRRPRRPGCWS